MERIGLISNDPRLKSDVRRWILEILSDCEFVDLGPPPTGDPPATIEVQPFKFLIYDSQFPVPLSKIRRDLKIEEPPCLAIGSEELAADPKHSKLQTAQDLILAPLDRLVFLQKIEYLLAGSASLSPSYLFQNKLDADAVTLELGKHVHVTHMSETGCTILAPRPLATGVEGTLQCSLFGPKELQYVEVRSVDSVPFFESNVAGQESNGPKFEVKLRFFGLRHAQLKNLRSWLIAHTEGGLPDIVRSEDAPASKMRVALITPHSSTAGELKSSLENLTQAELSAFGGLKRFHAYLANLRKPIEKSGSMVDDSLLPHLPQFIGPKRPEDLIPLIPVQPGFSPSEAKPVTIQFRLDDGFVEKISPKPKQGELLLGATMDAWGKDNSTLTKGLSNADREAVEEAIHWTCSNAPTQGERGKTTTVSVYYNASPATQGQLLYTFSLVSPAAPARSAVLAVAIQHDFQTSKSITTSEGATAPEFEAILIDASYLTSEPAQKCEQVAAWCEAYDVKNAFGNRPPIVVIHAPETLLSRVFRGTKVRQVAYDFSDRRYHAEVFISLSRRELWSSPGLAVAGHKTDIQAALFRPAKPASMSEVGFAVNDRVPIKRGTDLRVLCSLWPDSKHEVWGRLRANSDIGEGRYLNEFIFLGVADEIQKEIRRFTREDYVKKKAQGQG